MKILLIDDEQLDLFIAKKQLSPEHDVSAFSNPLEAIEWARSNDFSLALIDYYLGSELGTDVLRQIRSVKGSGFRAFLLTNYVDAQQLLSLKAEGFDEVIFKPLSLDKLQQHLPPTPRT